MGLVRCCYLIEGYHALVQRHAGAGDRVPPPTARKNDGILHRRGEGN